MEETIRNDVTQKYSKGAIAIHWLTALLIFLLFPLGKYMEGIEPAEKAGLVKIHVLLGIIVLILTAIRSWLFFKAPRPADLKTGSTFNDKFAIWLHNAFYFLLFGIAISGIATLIFGGYGEAISNGNLALIIDRSEILSLKGHGIMAFILMVFFVIHVIGVAKHYIVTKENTLRRIFF
ncbi:MAG: cytochrome b/b6 domain-containing protein [Bacteroidota bacterium]